MAHIDNRRKDYVRNLILTVGGPYLTNSQIYFDENPKAGNSFSLDDGRINMISIRMDYAHGPIDRLVGLIVQEFANTLVKVHMTFLDRCERDLIMWIGLSRRKYTVTRLLAIPPHRVTRMVFEGLFMGCRRILANKILVDQKAIDCIREHGLQLDGYVKFLEKELHDRNNFSIPRRLWHRWIVQKRIQASESYIRSVC